MFYFDPTELRDLLPDPVVKHLVDASPTSVSWDNRTLHALPARDDIPVVLIVRMSLSFPVLLAAVPLWYLEASSARTPRRCWFTDGGISSNLPLHLYDDALPAEPTFAIDLRGFHPDIAQDPTDPEYGVFLPNTFSEGVQEWRRPLDLSSPFRTVGGFVGLAWNAAQNWADNLFLPLPGYRERIAHVSLHGHEGGLNLEMENATIDDVAERGAVAGDLLARQFGPRGRIGTQPSNPVTWDSHRWTRLRAYLKLLERSLGTFDDGYTPDVQAMAQGQRPRGAYDKGFGKPQQDSLKNLVDLLAKWQRYQTEASGVFDRGNAPTIHACLDTQPDL